MRIAFAAPIHNLDLMDIGDYYVALPHLATPEYMEKLKNSDKYIMADNGAFEDEQPDADKYLDFCYKIEADEIIALDALKDPDSFSISRNFITEYDINQDFRVQVVPQDINPKEWLKTCRKWSHHQDLFDVLGIPLWLFSDYGQRNNVFEVLLHEQWFENKKYHYLGLDKVEELVEFHEYIDYIDTSLPITLADHGKKLRIAPKLYESKVDLLGSVNNIKLAKENCRKLQQFLIRLKSSALNKREHEKWDICTNWGTPTHTKN